MHTALCCSQQREYDISDYTRVPNTAALADRLRSCLQETEELPQNFTHLFNEDLFKVSSSLITYTLHLQLACLDSKLQCCTRSAVLHAPLMPIYAYWHELLCYNATHNSSAVSLITVRGCSSTQCAHDIDCLHASHHIDCVLHIAQT
jgi:hypothetical protein